MQQDEYGAPLEAERAVADIYRAMLKREPDSTGLAVHTSWLRKTGDLRGLLEAFLVGNEFDELQADHYRRVMLDQLRNKDFISKFPIDYSPPGEAGRCYLRRVRSGFLDRYCSGQLVLDVGFSGYDNPEGKTALPNAIGVDLDYPGYDGLRLPFADGSVDTVFSSHCLEHIQFDHAAIQDWYRVIKMGGFIVCMVPHQALYEKKKFLPSNFNGDHKRMYTASALTRSFEEALPVNSFRIRHLAENDTGFDYSLPPEVHSNGAYEIEIVVEKIETPSWELA